MLSASFIGITIVSLLLLFFASEKNLKIFLIMLPWCGITAGLALSGFYDDTTSIPPRFLTILFPSILLVVYLSRTLLVSSVRISWLIGLSIIRIPVELVLHQLYVEGLVPREMTFVGWNFDVLSGIGALLLVLFQKRMAPLTWIRWVKIWNTGALFLLTIILITAVLALPTPFQQLGLQHPNVAVMMFPYVWLPAIVVPAVVISHVLIFKWLKAQASEAV